MGIFFDFDCSRSSVAGRASLTIRQVAATFLDFAVRCDCIDSSITSAHIIFQSKDPLFSEAQYRFSLARRCTGIVQNSLRHSLTHRFVACLPHVPRPYFILDQPDNSALASRDDGVRFQQGFYPPW